ncbi:nuclear pore complex assembly-domain-containing protein [Podospora appendiculata]|uniref:Nuclear pore complex assembly-domain-containing protein n=1 Tax=Podospora appendiculata TaxID=314037 RepID=A0AAE0XCC6_9PEZI|nr:nuclear pore complex assembly-domain-containing protein [Podospora appendiculata]
MIDFTRFDVVFPSDHGDKPYDPAGLRSIETFRKQFNGVLFFDRVLKALELGQAGNAYPPKGESGLRTLHRQICDSKVSSHHKLSVLYYLLLDHDDIRGQRSQLAGALAEESGLPAKYQIFMRGLWSMDRGQFKFALEYLAHPSLPSEFADEIITTLVCHAEDNDYSMALAYYHATQPTLQTSSALELLFGALARTSVTEALYFSRRHPAPGQEQLFRTLVASVLDDAADAVATKGTELVSLPLSGAEEKWLQDVLVAAAGEGKGSKNARLVAQMRQIVTGRDRGGGSAVALNGLGGQKPAKAGRAAGW